MAILSGISGSASTDPNSKSGQSQVKLEEDLNRFLNLLVTQLKNQDPLDPLDANEFTSQLVQFASVEQQIYQNANIEKLINIQQSSQVSALVNFVGMTVEATGQQVPLENGEAKFSYTLGSNVSKTTISIVNSSGLTVFSTEAETSAGRHEYTWDGRDKSGNAAPEGSYTVIVSAQNREGALQDVEHTVYGRVTGAGADNGQVTLFLGDIEIPLVDILGAHETKTAEGETVN